MGSVYQKKYDKEVFFNEIFKKYNPVIRDLIKEDPENELIIDSLCKKNFLNIPFMAEHTVAKVGRLKQSNIPGEDFKDNSDLKTGSLRKDHRTKYSYQTTIHDPHKKKDMIRFMVYNSVRNQIDFFVFKLSDIGFDKYHKTRLDVQYHSKKDRYSKIEQFRVADFETFCRIKNV